jgi:cytochrome c-type biogenesis protein CcmE
VSESRGRRTRWFAAGAVGIAATALVFLTVGGIGENLVYYWGPTELRASGAKAVGATIRLGGQVAPGSVVWRDGAELEFDVVDQGARVHVKSAGVPPQMFREGIGVVVEGTLTPAGHFQCHRLMVSHSNEYRAPRKGESPDTRALMRSTEGLGEVSAAKP